MGQLTGLVSGGVTYHNIQKYEQFATVPGVGARAGPRDMVQLLLAFEF